MPDIDFITIVIIALTALVSYWAFTDRTLFYKLLLNPYQVWHRREWYRMVTHALVHGSMAHLFVNMLVLFFFAPKLVYIFKLIFGHSSLWFILLYITSVVVASVGSTFTYRDSPHYNSVGASGAVSAVLYATIFFDPMGLIYFFGIIPIPGIVFGILYLLYSRYMAQRGGDNINHDAHMAGAVYGFFFPVLIGFFLLGRNLMPIFIGQLGL